MLEARPPVTVFVHGSAEAGVGAAWGRVITNGQKIRTASAGDRRSSHIRMLMTGAAKSLESLRRGITITVVSRNDLLVRGVTEWLPVWKARGWRKSDKKPVENRDLWERLEAAAEAHTIVEWRRPVDGEEVHLIAAQEAAAHALQRLAERRIA